MDDQSAQSHHKIIDQTLGELLKTNPQAQQLIIKGMGITQEKFDEMLAEGDKNPIMQTKIGDLFTNGTVQKAVAEHDFVHRDDLATNDASTTASSESAPAQVQITSSDSEPSATDEPSASLATTTEPSPLAVEEKTVETSNSAAAQEQKPEKKKEKKSFLKSLFG